MIFLKQCLMVAILLPSLASVAQKDNKEADHPPYKRLYIGDTVPMEGIVFKNVRNHPGGRAKLSDFKGKFIILDFWSKGCSSCISAFPHMEELNNQFKEDIQILLVTADLESELMPLLKNSPNLKNSKLPIVIGDQVLTTQLFPHNSVPYHVWLDRDGKVIATTWAQETTAKNLKALVSGKSTDNIMVRNETFVGGWNDKSKDIYNKLQDPKQSLITIDNGRFMPSLIYYVPIPKSMTSNRLPESLSKNHLGQGLLTFHPLPYYSMFMSYNIEAEQLGIRSGNFELKNQEHKTIGLRITNTNIDYIYRFAYNDTGKLGDGFKKIIIEGEAKSLYEEITDTTNMKRHLINNSYCYESSLPNYSLENAKIVLRQDLSRFFGMTGNIEERPIKYLILTRLNIPAEKNLWAKHQVFTSGNATAKKDSDGWTFSGEYSLGSIFTYLQLANRSSEDPIILDGTDFSLNEYQKNINVTLKMENFKATPENISLMRTELEKYGLGLNEEVRKVKVLVLRALF